MNLAEHLEQTLNDFFDQAGRAAGVEPDVDRKLAWGATGEHVRFPVQMVAKVAADAADKYQRDQHAAGFIEGVQGRA